MKKRVFVQNLEKKRCKKNIETENGNLIPLPGFKEARMARNVKRRAFSLRFLVTTTTIICISTQIFLCIFPPLSKLKEATDTRATNCIQSTTTSSSFGLYKIEGKFELERKRLVFYEIQVCPGLKLAYHHIFKNAGTTMMSELSDFCRNSTGSSGYLLRSWDQTKKLNSFHKLCSENVCYTFWRDPIERFLSGFHELMKRSESFKSTLGSDWRNHMEHHWLFPLLNASLELPQNTTHQKKMSTLQSFWDLVKKGILIDGHIQPQTDFLSMAKGTFPAMSDIVYFDMRRSKSLLPFLFCGAYSKYAANESCPYTTGKIDHSRNRFSTGYGLPQYTIHDSQLDMKFIDELTRYYRQDYCFFSIKLHPRASFENLCY